MPPFFMATFRIALPLLLPLDIYAGAYDRSFWCDEYNIYWELDDCNSPHIWITLKCKENKKEFYERNCFHFRKQVECFDITIPGISPFTDSVGD